MRVRPSLTYLSGDGGLGEAEALLGQRRGHVTAPRAAGSHHTGRGGEGRERQTTDNREIGGEGNLSSGLSKSIM